LHNVQAPLEGDNVQIGSQQNTGIIKDITTLSDIANQRNGTEGRHQEYLGALLDIYRRLPATSTALTTPSQSVWIAPRREGNLIATCLRDETHGLTLAPHAKRMMVQGGMLVGLTDFHVPETVTEIVIIDGAIASGATIMAILHNLPIRVKTVRVISAHATRTSALCLLKYASGLGITLMLTIGHISGILNSTYYAVDPEDVSKVIVGDLGDMTAGAFVQRLPSASFGQK
jgi:hypothetical protein